MPRAVQLINAFKQNITGGAFEALAAGTGDSLTVANFRDGSRATIDEIWSGTKTSVASFDIRSPRMHDNVRGLRMTQQFNPTLSGPDGNPQILFPGVAQQPVYKSDVLTCEVNGTAADNTNLAFLVDYEDLPGIAARLATWQEIQPRIVNYVGILVNATAGATGDWGTTRAFNADDDRLIADTDYAVLGYTVQAPLTGIAIVGPDTGNFRIGGPGHWDEEKTGHWFVLLSMRYGIPYIPIINSNNKGITAVQAFDTNGATASQSVWLLAELD
jgi:hypothetical protein